MVTFGGMTPIVGKDVFGNAANMSFDPNNNRSILSRNIQSVGASETTSDPSVNPSHTNPNTLTTNKTWDTVSITSLYSSGGTTLALGSGQTIDKTTQSIVYTDVSGKWVAGLNPLPSNPRPNGTVKASDKFIVATGDNTIVSTFIYNPSMPAGGGLIKSLPEIIKTNTGVPIDNLSNNGTVVVGGSMTRAGTWTAASDVAADKSEWGHNVGEAELKLTTHRSTSYTFPGYTATSPQIQRVSGLPNGDNPPVDWASENDRTNGYYGVIGGPQITVTWTKPPA